MADGNWSIGDDPAADKVSRVASDVSPRALMVLGMHRSGTSALTRIFNLLGADLPKNLMPAHESNPTGHWESNDLVVIHERLLESAGSNWHDWRKFNPEWLTSPPARQFTHEVLAVLRKDFAGSSLFAIKDPRICRFWPFWRDVLQEFGATPLVAMPVRNPLEIAASLKRRDGFLATNSLLLWLRHVLDAEHDTRGLPRAIVSYESLVADWQHAISTMTPQLRLSWPRRGATSNLAIEQYLSAEFKHHSVTPEYLAGKPEVVDWVRDAYAALMHLAEHPDDPVDLATLDAVRAAFDKASEAFGVLLALGEAELVRRAEDFERQKSSVASLAAELETVKGERERATAELNILKPTLDELVQIRTQLVNAEEAEKISTSELRQARARLASTEKALARARTETVATREEANGHAGERDKLAAALEEERAAAAQNAAQATSLSLEIETLRNALREQESATASHATDLGRARAVIVEHHSQIGTLRSELATAHSVVKDRDGAIVRLMRDLDGARGYLRESQTHMQRLTGELDGARTETKRGEIERVRLAKIVADGAAELEATHLRIATLQGERDGLQGSASQLPALRAQVEALKQALADARIAADRQHRTLAESTARLEDASTDKTRFAEELERTKDAARRGERSAADRIAALAASRAAALAASDNKAAARIRALQNQLTDAEAALAKYANGQGNGASWIRRLSVARRRALRLIASSGLFDADWYAREYPDAAANGRPPAEHYLDEGYLRGYRPNPLFDTRWYLEHYEDVRRAGINPLLHYIHNGAREGRDPGPDFHTDFYLVSNPDVRESGMNPLYHYLRHGRTEGRLATRPDG